MSIFDFFNQPAWKKQGVCKDYPQEMWFGSDEFERSPNEKDLPGIDLCHVCPVEQDCLEYAIKNKIHSGIWGGKTADQRKRLRRKLLNRNGSARV